MKYSLSFMLEHIFSCFSSGCLWRWRVLCLISAFLVQPVAAERIVLGAPYSAFDNLIIVRVDASDAQNCANLRDAIANTSGIRTLRLPPATYDCGTTSLDIPSGVTLEGLGQQHTRIIGQLSAISTPVVSLLGGSELYNLTVENTITGSSTGTNVALGAEADSVINHVTIISQGANNDNVGILLSTSSVSERVRINHATIRVDNGRSFNDGIFVGPFAMATLNDVSVFALDTSGTALSRGVTISSNGSPSLLIRQSVLNSSDNAIETFSTGSPTVSVAHSQLTNGVIGSGTFTCFGAYGENLEALSGNCVVVAP